MTGFVGFTENCDFCLTCVFFVQRTQYTVVCLCDGFCLMSERVCLFIRNGLLFVFDFSLFDSGGVAWVAIRSRSEYFLDLQTAACWNIWQVC